MSVTVTSTTDSKEAITKAIGMFSKEKPVVEKPSAPAEKSVDAQSAQAEPASETKDATEASNKAADPVEPGDDADPQSTDAQANDAQAGKDKKGGFQRRIDKLTKARSAAEQERDYWRELATKSKDAKEPAQVSAQPQAAQDAADPEPKPDSFEDVGSYMKALTRWEIKQEQKKADLAKKTAEVKASFENKIKDFHKKVGDFKKVTADFDDVAAEFDETYPSGMPNTMLDLIAESENGPQMMYDIAKDHAEFERLAKLSPIALAREIGKREARFAASSGEKPTQNKTTKAPAPITPVKGGAATTTKDPDKMTYQEFRSWRENGGGQ